MGTVYHAVALRTCPCPSVEQMFQRNEGGALKGCHYYGEFHVIRLITIVSGTQWRVK